MSDVFSDAVVKALRGMKDYPPEDLLEAVNFHLRRSGVAITGEELVETVLDPDRNDPARMAFHIQLARWEDAEHGPDWTADAEGVGTGRNSPERRALVLRCLGLDPQHDDEFAEAFPVRSSGTVVIAEEAEDWEPWYTEERAAERSFYWDAYRGLLASRMDPLAVERLDGATREVVGRLADPCATLPYQSKGLVVGHVQSGKTANFTGVIAKAVDAGYRLVIVLTGTIEMLRSQTQRRLDMELVGEENILGGIPRDDERLLKDVDYAGNGDRDWVAGRFIRHGIRPKDVGAPEIRRLTRSNWDYKNLAAGLSTLDFRSGNELADPAKKLWDPINIHGADVRIAVVKKHKGVLGKLIDDLRRIHADLGEIPTLIIDDEADQASINTKRHRPSEEDRDRSAINAKISELLALLKRAQYVGYTATPFANVFVDPDDSADIFPRDFIISLAPPDGYMGGRDFHDLHWPEELEKTVENGSKEKAFVRGLYATQHSEAERSAEFTLALDSYVLAGAIKLWRADRGHHVPTRHHTMLVHESVKQDDHGDLAEYLHSVWKSAAYSQPAGLRRLAELWESDFLPVCRRWSDGAPVPANFAELRTWVGAAVDRIHKGKSPFAVINGDKDAEYAQPDLDFQRGDVWKILVGGTKLSRGFTVEGLTTSVYTRRTQAADTLMQMGRWFGYRRGYKDLVRLFVGRNVPGPRATTVDLYEMFEAIVRDEEDFREELRAFQGLNDEGKPLMRPIDVPPMVFQSLPSLRPTGANKMYNAELVFKGEGGRTKDFVQQGPRRTATNRGHFRLVAPWLDAAAQEGTFYTRSGSSYTARYGIVTADVFLEAARAFSWAHDKWFTPTEEFVRRAQAEGHLEDVAVLIPLLEDIRIAKRRIGGREEIFHIQERKRRGEDRKNEFSGSSIHQRLALEIISGGVDPANHIDLKIRRAALAHPLAQTLHTASRGALLVTFAADTKDGIKPVDLTDPVNPENVATLFSFAFPKAAAPKGRIGFRAIQPNGPLVIPNGIA